MKQKIVAVIGLGYVGLPLVVEFGKRLSTIGFDISQQKVERCRSGRDPSRELTNAEMAKAKNACYTSNPEALRDAELIIVAVPTPVDAANIPDLKPLIGASVTVGRYLKPGATVIFESTVYPGATEEVCIPIIERESGLKWRKDFFVGYSPERINPGDKEHSLTKILKVVSGDTPETLDRVAKLYELIIEPGVHRASSIKTAEAAKVIENTQRDLNIALMNELAIIFDKMGIDTGEVLAAAGTKWNFLNFKPGLVGGHCIGVDPYYLTHKAEEVGYHPQVILAGRRINDNMARYAARNVIRLMLKNGIDVARSTVGVMGITFKENCPDIRNSKVADLVKELQNWGCNVVVSDPWANAKEVEHEYGIRLGTIDESNQVDSLIVAVGHNEFRTMSPKQLKKLCGSGQPVLADVKALYNRHDAAEVGFTVFRL